MRKAIYERPAGEPDNSRFATIILVAPLMMSALTLLSLCAAFFTPMTSLPEIRLACMHAGIDLTTCTAGATSAGIYTLASNAITMLAVAWLLRRHSHPKSAALPVYAVTVLLVISFAVVLTHTVGQLYAPAFGSRIDELKRFSNLISLENVLWPLLAQVVLTQTNAVLRTAVIAALMSILTLTIFRTAGLTVLIFAFLVPWASLLWQTHTFGWKPDIVRRLAIETVIVTLFTLAIGLGGTTDSQSRTLEVSPTQEGSEGLQGATAARLQQRLAYPLYQAAIVAHISKTTQLPTIVDEILRKFRLSSKPSLNEYVYDRLEPGGAGIGQTTSLYYGEAHAYFGSFATPWTLLAPLLFVAIWFGLRRADIEAGALIGIQLWRSSFAGIITMVPSLAIQVATLCAMTLAPRIFKIRDRGSLNLFLLAAVAALAFGTAIAQTVNIADTASRRSFAQISIAPATSCNIVGNTHAIADSIDRAFASANIRSVVTSVDNDRVVLLVPRAPVVLAQRQTVLDAVYASIHCDDASASTPATITNVSTVSGGGFVPLNLLAILFNLVSSALVGYFLFSSTLKPRTVQLPDASL